MTRRALRAAGLVLAVGCTEPKPVANTARQAPTSPAAERGKPADSAAPPGRCGYRVKAPASAPYVVEVTARCEGFRVMGFEPDDPELTAFVRKGSLTSPTPGAVEQTYSVDLDGMAAKFDRFDTAARFGQSLVAAASSYLFAPMPAAVGVPVSVVVVDESNGFATGLRRGTSGYAIETHELRVATYTAFGAKEIRSLEAPGATLRMALLDGPIALGAERMARWVETAFRAVASFYERPPDVEILVVIAPLAKTRGVRFGRLLPESAPGIVMLVGEETTEADLGNDWMLVHELFHIGSPSYGAKSGWFDEGLATYFEPLIRVRAGLYDEKKLWKEFSSEMPRGIEALTTEGLQNGDSRDDIYWGGGLFCLLADVEARRVTNGKKGLEDGLRAVLRAGGTSSEVWTIEDTFETIDEGIGAPVVRELAKRHTTGGSPVDLARLFKELGVVRTRDGIRLDDRAPLAAVRRAIVHGAAKSP